MIKIEDKFMHSLAGDVKKEFRVIDFEGTRIVAVDADGETYSFPNDRMFYNKVQAYHQLGKDNQETVLNKMNSTLFTFDRRYMFLMTFYPELVNNTLLEGRTNDCNKNILDESAKQSIDPEDILVNLKKIFPFI